MRCNVNIMIRCQSFNTHTTNTCISFLLENSLKNQPWRKALILAGLGFSETQPEIVLRNFDYGTRVRIERQIGKENNVLSIRKPEGNWEASATNTCRGTHTDAIHAHKYTQNLRFKALSPRAMVFFFFLFFGIRHVVSAVVIYTLWRSIKSAQYRGLFLREKIWLMFMGST